MLNNITGLQIRVRIGKHFVPYFLSKIYAVELIAKKLIAILR